LTMALPQHPDGAQCRQRLNALELELALDKWAKVNDAPRGPEMLKALELLQVRDLQGLRKEVNCRILPEKKRSDRKRKKPGGQGTQGSAFPFPREEKSLLALSDRILELERLKRLVCLHVPYEKEYAEVLEKLLGKGVDSVSALAQHSLDNLQLGLGQDCLESLGVLLDEAKRQAGEDEVGRIARRSEMIQYGRSPFLVTAPHNIFLRRDGCTPHMREDFTSVIAQRLAQELDGTAMCWTRLEQWRSETFYALGHRRIADQGQKSTNEALDPTNRDPNYLRVQELHGNPWHCGLKEFARQCRQVSKTAQLHVDVHGCQNPPVYPTHMVVGLGAFRRRIEEMPRGPKREQALKRLVAFASALRETLGPAVAPHTGLQVHEIVTITGAGEEAGCPPSQDFLVGVSSDPQRRTLTQQSLLHVGVSHGLQLEISLRLRKLLVGEPAAIDKLARTLRTCWRKSFDVEGG